MPDLSDDAREIFAAAVDAVRPAELIHGVVTSTDDVLTVDGRPYSATEIDRVLVVGAGKAGAAMACGVHETLTGPWRAKTDGWVNVPADCVPDPTDRILGITIHAARPAGVNEPRAEGAAGAAEIVSRVRSLGPRDMAVVLISGGGSALLPAPRPGVTLDQKLLVTRLLSSRGANIEQMNLVRRQLSAVKGGGLLRGCGAAVVETLIISDVIGDPLEAIASGPTVPIKDDPAEAVTTLRRFARDDELPAAVWETVASPKDADDPLPQFANSVIGSNEVAVAAAAQKAEALGYLVHNEGGGHAGEAAEVGRSLAGRLAAFKEFGGRHCVLNGGEPVVRLTETDRPRKGGRNQELVLAALDSLSDWSGLCLLSGGTDGEDGPTDAAGGIADADVAAAVRRLGLDVRAHLSVNDSYPVLDAAGGLLRTGPTGTNVMDVRVGLIDG